MAGVFGAGVGAVATGWISGAAVVAVKGWSEVLQANGNNNLARQGLGVPALSGDSDRAERQRVAGIGISQREGQEPAFLDKVPKKDMTGDIRGQYNARSRGKATSSQGSIDDILSKVPRGVVGASGDYKRAARSEPSRQGGFSNQSYPG